MVKSYNATLDNGMQCKVCGDESEGYISYNTVEGPEGCPLHGVWDGQGGVGFFFREVENKKLQKSGYNIKELEEV